MADNSTELEDLRAELAAMTAARDAAIADRDRALEWLEAAKADRDALAEQIAAGVASSASLLTFRGGVTFAAAPPA